jgi:type VI protein secretion system component VasK
MTETKTDGPLRLERTISLALLVAVVLETVGALLWAGRTVQRVEQVEAALRVQAPVAERLARLEEQSSANRATLERIERKIDREAGR